ncbi:MAG: galactokinase [Planctomycetota bacterium]|jgi:galactokinase
MSVDLQATIERFRERFGREPAGAVAAPGRVNLIGEHTDYNDGFVLPIAIERDTAAVFAPREDRIVRFVSAQADESAEIDLSGALAAGEPAWANYSIGVAAGLVQRGAPIGGADIFFDSDVPLGGGLSSSASLEVATAMALLGGTKGDIPDAELATICQMAEHNFAGTPCGIMDQSIAIMGQAGRALLLDCRDSHTQQIPFDNPDLVLLVADTQVKHELSDGGYAARRDQCYVAAEKLGVKMLRDADHDQVAAGADKLSEKELMRVRHVVGEIERTLEAVGALEAGDYERFGHLMVGSHDSLRDDYEVSCEELDAIVEFACGCEGVFGARMTGGGFGGCAIILVAADHAEAVTTSVGDGFEARFGHRCPIFATMAAQGARRLM